MVDPSCCARRSLSNPQRPKPSTRHQLVFRLVLLLCASATCLLWASLGFAQTERFQNPPKSYKALTAETYKRVLEKVFPREAKDDYILRFEPSFAPESQIVIRTSAGKTEVVELTSLSGNIYSKLDGLKANGATEDAVEMARLIQVRKRTIEVPPGVASRWLSNFSESHRASIRLLTQRRKESRRGIGTVTIEGTLYTIWSGHSHDVFFQEWDSEVSDRKVTGESKLVQWMNTVRRDVGSNQVNQDENLTVSEETNKAFPQSSVLRVIPRVIGSQYCVGDSELDSLKLNVELTYVNVSNENLIIYNGLGRVSREMVAKNLNDLEMKRFEVNSTITTIFSSGDNCYVGASPGKCFVILRPGGSYRTETVTGVFAVRGDARQISGAVHSGNHFLQIELLTWHESKELADELRSRWRQFGKLWYDPITSPPFAITVDRDRVISDCP